jgi:hypothetical protein
MLFARRHDGNRSPGRDGTLFVNLCQQPRTSVEALALTGEIRRAVLPQLYDNPCHADLRIGDVKYGEAFTVDSKTLGTEWGRFAAFAQSELTKCALELAQGTITVLNSTGAIPLVPLQMLGELGFDRRDIHDAFFVTEKSTPYPAVWNHDARAVRTISIVPNKYLRARVEPAEGRNLRSSSAMWEKAGRLMLAERFRLNTMRAVATYSQARALSNVWWPFSTRSGLGDVHSRALALWLNGTVGLVLFLFTRQDTEGPWISCKKPTWGALPVLDVSTLSPSQLERVEEVYQDIARKTLQSVALCARDEVRIRIDDLFAELLSLPPLNSIRELLAKDLALAAKRAPEHMGS